MKNYYELLEIAPDAPAEDVKKSFRAQIAKYHPDKVQHLGKEFQAMAADRAAELTEAYRILSNAERRAEYDKQRASGSAPVAVAPPPAPPATAASSPPPAAERPPVPDEPPPQSRTTQFEQERHRRDMFIRKATMDRFRQAFAQVAGAGYDEASVRGFDFASTPKSKLFGRGKGPAFLARFVPQLDATSLAEAWADAGKWQPPSGDEMCVILMSTTLAPPRELADAIQEQRRRPGRSGARVTLIPVNSSMWDAHMPNDAPAVARDLLARLRTGK